MKPRKRLNKKRERRVARVAAVISGTATNPRLVVNRSNRYVYAQLIDDTKGRTIAAVSSFGKQTEGSTKKMTKSEAAFAAGEAIAKKAAEKGIVSAVFDRRASRFHGRVQSFADGAKKGGLKI